MLNEDYKDILRAFIDENVKFLLVGAYAMAAHGYLRGTEDIDLWIEPSVANAPKVLRALNKFGAPPGDLTRDDLQQEGIIYQIGVAPNRIDIITTVDGLHFADAEANARQVRVDGIPLSVVSINDLIHNKKSTGRSKDIADAEELEKIRKIKNDPGAR